MMKRTGEMNIITTVLLILLTLVLIGIISLFLFPFLKNSTEGKASVKDCIAIDLEILRCSYTEGVGSGRLAFLTLSRRADRANISDIAFVFHFANGTQTRVDFSNVLNDSAARQFTQYNCIPKTIDETDIVLPLPTEEIVSVQAFPKLGKRICERGSAPKTCERTVPHALRPECQDYNLDDVVNPDDLGDYITEMFFLQGSAPVSCSPRIPTDNNCIDFNQNGFLEVNGPNSDLALFITNYFSKP